VPKRQLPPEKLMRRVGWFMGADAPADVFEQRGKEQWALVRSLLPGDMTLLGRRVLDFGCGAGRMLKAAVADQPDAEFWGCDIDRESVEWLARDLDGRAHVFLTRDRPPLPVPDGHFHLIYAFSVFTHLVDRWSDWLLDLHRALDPSGLLIATVIGPGRHSSLNDEPVAEDLIGMNVLAPSNSWDAGGPLVLHSEWWLRAHWGRAFEILELRAGDQEHSPPQYGQAVVVMRKRPGSFSSELLEQPEADEPREIAALRQNVASLRREVARQSELIDSRSWRLTAPARAVARVYRDQLRRRP
jgi:SAM-dependent methyltransferase